jgi:hypothetical protein
MAAAGLGEVEAPAPRPSKGRAAVVRVRSSLSGHRTAWLVLGVSTLALLPRVVTALADFRTQDEMLWMIRSGSFYDALRNGSARGATAGAYGDGTSPGITTMWIGSLSRTIWAFGRGHGLWAAHDKGFVDSQTGLGIGQLLMAVATAALIGLLVLLLVRWVGPGPAVVAGVLVATEPFFVAHGAVLHTDELVALSGVGSLLALALALGIPNRTSWTGRWWAAALAGGLFAVAWLTKLTALTFVPSAVLLGAWALVRARRSGRAAQDGQDGQDGHDATPTTAALVRMGALWVVAALLVISVAYPALRVAPIDELRFLWRSAGLAGKGHLQFFLGKPTLTPGPSYYFVALPFRTTPWLLVGSAVAAVALWTSRARRAFGLALVCMAVPSLLVLSFASKQLDRYGLPLLVIAAIAVGIVVTSGAERLARTSSLGRHLPIAGALATLVVGVHSLAIAPWGLAYFNPALGGAPVAEHAILVGWSEGLEGAGRFIARREAGRCDSVTIAGPGFRDLYPCGTLVSSTEDPTYVVVYVSERQRWEPARLAALVADRELVGTVEEVGVTYAEIYGPAEHRSDGR